MTDIYATIGPASVDQLSDLYEAGMTGARLTFSFGTPEIQLERARNLIAAAGEGNRVRIIADLEGGGDRIGEIVVPNGDEALPVALGDQVELFVGTEIETSTLTKIPVPNSALLDRLMVGDELVVGDNSAQFRIQNVTPDQVTAECSVAGMVEGRRGLSVLRADLVPACLTEKDRSDLEHIGQHPEYDAVAVSFVSGARDIETVRSLLQAVGGEQKVIAKIETPEAVSNISEICAAADEIMVARGDLALTMPWYEMPAAVAQIVATCQATNTPYIMATQVAEGTLHGNSLTRAEMTDLWHWCQTGLTGVLLSRETAWGERPATSIAQVRQLLDYAAQTIK